MGFLAMVIILFFYRAGGFLTNEKIKYQNEKLVTAKIAGKNFLLEVARDDAERKKGLSGRLNLASDQGMLFVFERRGYWGIWMKDMRFPIDILWLDETYCIIDSKINLTPETFPEVFRPKTPAKYIIELSANSLASAELPLCLQKI